MAYSTGLHRLATSASRRSMGCGFCKGFRLPILPFPNNKRLNTQKYPAFASQLLPAKNPYSTASREYGFSALFSSRSRCSHLRSRCFHHRSTRRHRIRSCAFGFGSSALEAASTAAFCAAEAADAPSAATVEAASCAAEAAWLAAGLLSPQAASNKDIKATDSSDFFMFNTFKYFLSLNKKQNESAK